MESSISDKDNNYRHALTKGKVLGTNDKQGEFHHLVKEVKPRDRMQDNEIRSSAHGVLFTSSITWSFIPIF